VAGFGWVVLVRAHGAASEYTSSHRLHALFRGNFEALDRVGPSLRSEISTSRWVLIATLLVGLVGFRHLVRPLRTGGGAPAWLIAAAGALAVLATAAYTVSPYDLDWQLHTSVARTMVAPQMLCLATVALVVGGALAEAWAPGAKGARDASSPVAATPRSPAAHQGAEVVEPHHV
jgi:hypothetical protein